MSKVIEYVGWVHALKDRLKENWTQFWHSETEETEEKETNFRAKVKDKLEKLTQRTITRINHSSNNEEGDFSHLTRTKTRMELVQISAAVMGIEFSYAAETAFVSPLLLNIGLRHRHMTLMWCLSPLLGFFVTPLLGSVSDGCRSPLGRRRPFIILLSIGIIMGLILVPNGKSIGLLLGDTYKTGKSMPILNTTEKLSMEGNFTTAFLPPENQTSNLKAESLQEAGFNPIENSSSMINSQAPYKHPPHQWVVDDSGKSDNFMERQFDEREQQDVYKKLKLTRLTQKNEDTLESLIRQAKEANNSTEEERFRNESLKAASLTVPDSPLPTIEEDKSQNENENSIANHPWGLIFTVIGTVLLDFDADACQSPSRAYMLDVTIPADHARGLSTFTIMAGLGGSMGYFLGALNWENTFIGTLFGGQVRAVFTVVLFIFIGCVITTIRSFQEIPIDRLYSTANKPSGSDRVERGEYSRFEEEENYSEAGKSQGYGSIENVQETSFNENQKESPPVAPIVHGVEGALVVEEKAPTFREYVKTIVQMPRSLQWLCVTNFFCWMSLVCYSLYFTDFVGEAVYGGDPTAPLGSVSRTNYEDGVRFGCWGMSLYSLSCSFYSFAIDGLVHRFGAKRVYICGQLIYSVGMVFMGTFRHKASVIIFSWTAGIMYATLFTMPYLLVARYHAAEMFEVDVDELVQKPNQRRGLGTDVAIVSSMVFLAQMTQAIILGSVVTAAGTPTAIVYAAALFASCGALAATKVLYLDL